MFNKDKKKEQRKELTPIEILENKYVDNLCEYIEFNEKYYEQFNIQRSEEQREKLVEEYNNAISEIVRYLLVKFPDSTFNSNLPAEIVVTDMYENLSSVAFNMLRIPSYPGIIDIIRGTYSTHFHTEGDRVTEAEEVQVLPGLLPSLRTEKINKIFKGLTVKETRDLLKQMHILPIANDLERVIKSYDDRNKVYKNFLRSVIYSLLSKAHTEADIKRARLFAASFDVDFDFTPYEALVTKDNKLKLD